MRQLRINVLELPFKRYSYLLYLNLDANLSKADVRKFLKESGNKAVRVARGTKSLKVKVYATEEFVMQQLMLYLCGDIDAIFELNKVDKSIYYSYADLVRLDSKRVWEVMEKIPSLSLGFAKNPRREEKLWLKCDVEKFFNGGNDANL